MTSIKQPTMRCSIAALLAMSVAACSNPAAVRMRSACGLRASEADVARSIGRGLVDHVADIDDAPLREFVLATPTTRAIGAIRCETGGDGSVLVVTIGFPSAERSWYVAIVPVRDGEAIVSELEVARQVEN